MKARVREAVELPFKQPEALARLGVVPPRGEVGSAGVAAAATLAYGWAGGEVERRRRARCRCKSGSGSAVARLGQLGWRGGSVLCSQPARLVPSAHVGLRTAYNLPACLTSPVSSSCRAARYPAARSTGLQQDAVGTCGGQPSAPQLHFCQGAGAVQQVRGLCCAGRLGCAGLCWAGLGWAGQAQRWTTLDRAVKEAQCVDRWGRRVQSCLEKAVCAAARPLKPCLAMGPPLPCTHHRPCPPPFPAQVRG